jgi:hypothetical protein
MVLEVGLVDQGRDASFENSNEVLIRDKVPSRVIRGTNDDDFCP